MMTNRGISVIIPCFNRESTIKQCIESVLSQDFTGDMEIIVSDDGSTDNSIELVKSIDNTKIILIEKNINNKEKGASAARNRALEIAKYEYVCFLDSDDYYLPNCLNAMVNALDLNQNIGYAFCRAKKEIELTDGTRIIEDWTRKRLSYLDKKYHVLYRGSNINTNVIFIRRSVLRKIGFFDIQLTVGEDSDLWIRISEVSKGIFVNIYGSVYRVNHSNNQLTQTSDDIKQVYEIKIITRALQRLIESNNNDNIRFYLIFRKILFLRMANKLSIIDKIIRRVVVSFKSLLMFPLTYIRFIIYAYLSRK